MTTYFEQCLHHPSNREALQYMLDRGTQTLLEPFRVGYAPNDPQALRNHLLAAGYTDKQMIEAGVMRPSKKAESHTPFSATGSCFPYATAAVVLLLSAAGYCRTISARRSRGALRRPNT